MRSSLSAAEERPPGVPAVVWDMLTVLNNDVKGITALTTYKRDAVDAADLAAAELFGRIERRLRDEVGQLQDLLNERQKAGVLPPDFEMPTGEDEVDD
jgi:hypothetical protein